MSINHLSNIKFLSLLFPLLIFFFSGCYCHNCLIENGNGRKTYKKLLGKWEMVWQYRCGFRGCDTLYSKDSKEIEILEFKGDCGFNINRFYLHNNEKEVKNFSFKVNTDDKTEYPHLITYDTIKKGTGWYNKAKIRFTEKDTLILGKGRFYSAFVKSKDK